MSPTLPAIRNGDRDGVRGFVKGVGNGCGRHGHVEITMKGYLYYVMSKSRRLEG